MRRTKKLFVFVLTLAVFCLLLPPFSTFAVDIDDIIASDITSNCNVTSSEGSGSTDSLLDYSSRTIWKPKDKDSYITIEAKDEFDLSTLYIEYFTRPSEKYTIYYSVDGTNFDMELTFGGANGLLTEIIYLPLRVKAVKLNIGLAGEGVCDLRIYNSGRLPDGVPKWQPEAKKATMMVVSTHLDDELLWFGGTLPTYGGQEQLDLVMVYAMNKEERFRRTEGMNGLWECGINQQPIFLNYPDSFTMDLTQAFQDEVLGSIVLQIRKYKPEVMITQDLKGEYGHKQHIMVSNLVLKAFDVAADEKQYPDSAKEFGAWQVKKLYTHLFPENIVTLKWDTPLSKFEGRTAIEVARAALVRHQSQSKIPWHMEVDGGPFPCTKFGLAKTTVGLDQEKKSFLENIPSKDITPRKDQLIYAPHFPLSPDEQRVADLKSKTKKHQSFLLITAAFIVCIIITVSSLNLLSNRERNRKKKRQMERIRKDRK